MDNYSIDDMITSVLEKKPETFKDAFDSIMATKFVSHGTQYSICKLIIIARGKPGI